MVFKKLFALIYFVTGIISFSYSQDIPVDSSSRNALFVEALGNGYIYSINYDRIFFSKNKSKLTARGGFGFLPGKITQSESNDYFFVSELNLLHGKENNFFETGIGLTFLYQDYPADYYPNDRDDEDDPHWLIVFRFGYRLQEQKGFFFRAAFTPVIVFGIEDFPIFPWAGFSFGKTF